MKMYLATAIIVLMACGSISHAEQLTTSSDEYIVKSGETLRSIADQHDLDWKALWDFNATYLQERYGKTCPQLPETFRKRPLRKGFFCNEGQWTYNFRYANTLLPGWKILIPTPETVNTATTAVTSEEPTQAKPEESNEANVNEAPNSTPASAAIEVEKPEDIEKIVQQHVIGQRVALVIDDTGSMTDDRITVTRLYTAALKTYQKNLISVWLYADGRVRRYKPDSVEFHMYGGIENTLQALDAANSDKPDSIILITDEIGDDWNEWEEMPQLPPIIAHCLLDRRVDPWAGGCKGSLTALVHRFGGTYVESGGRIATNNN